MNTLERAATRKWLDRETVQEVLNYDPETGIFTWRARDEEMFPNARAANAYDRAAQTYHGEFGVTNAT